jgi:hypothetical protein
MSLYMIMFVLCMFIFWICPPLGSAGFANTAVPFRGWALPWRFSLHYCGDLGSLSSLRSPISCKGKDRSTPHAHRSVTWLRQGLMDLLGELNSGIQVKSAHSA